MEKILRLRYAPLRMTKTINTIGVYTLCKREIWRFMKVWNQTVIAPIVTTLLFLAVLTLATGGSQRMIDDLPYNQFVAPGLIMMAIVQNAFANTSSSLMLAKIQGVIIDILMPPLTGAEIVFSLVVGGIVRGAMVGVAVMAAVYVFVPFTLHSGGVALFYVISASIMMALFGVLTGIWSQSFDQLSAITNYIITPLAFLSGTFYSIHHLPDFWQRVCHFNPFFYMIDGFRYSITGYTDGNVGLGMVVLTAVNIVLWTTTAWLFKKGYRLKT
jgi:ABC-2 type transport system permease protein